MSASSYTASCNGSVVSAVDPWLYVRNVVARSGTSFIWGMRVLPKDRRHAMYAIYAFCREVDDIVDEPGDISEKLRALENWREQIHALYAGKPSWPTTRALLGPIDQFGLPQEEFLTVIDGMQLDAAPRVRIQTLDELLGYCRKVAGAVGVLSIRVFGVSLHPGLQFAKTLGNAFQLTNILRDLKEDAALQRLYVPLETLAEHGVAEGLPNEVLTRPGFSDACEELATLAREYYADAETMAAQLGRRNLLPALLMMAVYRETLDRLERRGWTRIHDPVRLTSGRKMWLALRYGLL